MNKSNFCYERYIKRLQSNNVDVLGDVLSELSGLYEVAPKGLVRNLIVENLNHKDPYVSEMAIWAAGLHWKFPEAYKIILKIANNYTLEEDVILKSLTSITVYPIRDEVKKDDVINSLVKFIRDDRWDLKSRIYIYNNLLHYIGELTLSELAICTVQKTTEKIDFNLLDSLVDKND